MKQQERQQKSREKILSAAMQEFAERGYEEVTVDSICQKYEISKGMLYHYYSGKDALFLLCVQQTFQQLEEYLLERMEQLEQKDPVEAMQEYFLLRESFFQENPQQKQIFEAALLRAPIQLTEQIEQIREDLGLNDPFQPRIPAPHPSAPAAAEGAGAGGGAALFLRDRDGNLEIDGGLLPAGSHGGYPPADADSAQGDPDDSVWGCDVAGRGK